METLTGAQTPAAAAPKARRGGKRDGAGRPKGSTHIPHAFKRVRISFRLPQHLVDWLKDRPKPMGPYIEDLIYEDMTKGLALDQE